jgi:predicted nucleic-acid-binding Zn-ribbon protein
MDAEGQLAESFCCAKCHNRQAVARTAAISGGLPNLLGFSSDKYVLVSCTLCGYTEIYNTQLICSLSEEEIAASKVPARPQP